MKKYLFLFILLGLLAPSLAAQEFTEGIFTYRVLNDDQGNPTTNVAIVNSTLEENTDVVIPDKVSYDGQEYIVSHVEDLYIQGGGRHFKSLHLPATIQTISQSLLYFSCQVKEAITVEETNPYFKAENNVLFSKDGTKLYGAAENIESAYIPDCVKVIKYGAFAGCLNIKEVTLPETVEEVEMNAFDQCANLTKVELNYGLKKLNGFGSTGVTFVDIPSTVEEISRFAFVPSLEEFSVDSNNRQFASWDGCIYNKGLTELIRVPSAKLSISYPESLIKVKDGALNYGSLDRIVIPNSVIEIEGAPFGGCKATSISLPSTITKINSVFCAHCNNLKEIVIPPSVTLISHYAFLECTSLESVVIPESVETVSASAFYRCGPNTNIIFIGKDVDIDATRKDYDSNTHLNPKYFASGQTHTRLLEAFEQNTEIVKQLPEHVLFGGRKVDFMGPESRSSSIIPLYDFFGVANGLQLDMTLPEGLAMSEIVINDGTGKCVSTCSRLANGDYRLLAYMSDGTDFPQSSKLSYMMESDASFKRSEVRMHNIIASIKGVKYPLADEIVRLTGYNVEYPDWGEIEEGENVQLKHPFSVDQEGVSYQFSTSNPEIANVDENNVFHAFLPGTIELRLKIEDTNYSVPSGYKIVTVTPALWGDADRSKAIDLADVVAVVNHILEREVENFSAKLADVNRDGSIDVADLTSIVKLVLAQPVPDEGGENVVAAPGLRELSFGEAQLGADGKRHISLEIETSSDYTAMQTDIELPEGYTVESVSLGSELGKHALDYAAVAPQTTRLILYSASLAELPAGRKAAVVDLTLSGAGEGSIRASRALACDADGRSYTLAATEAPLNITTGVSSAESAGMGATAVAGGMEITAPAGTAVTVCDIAGRVLLSFTADATPAFRPFAPGVYVVAFEGSAATAKVLVK